MTSTLTFLRRRWLVIGEMNVEINVNLNKHVELSIAYMFDCETLLCFARQVNVYGNAGDVVLGIFYIGQ